MPSPQIIFNSPTDGDNGRHAHDAQADPVLEGACRGHDRGSLPGPVCGRPGGSESDLPLRVTYDAATRSIEVRFAQPPERLRTVRLELIDGLAALTAG